MFEELCIWGEMVVRLLASGVNWNDVTIKGTSKYNSFSQSAVTDSISD